MLSRQTLMWLAIAFAAIAAVASAIALPIVFKNKRKRDRRRAEEREARDLVDQATRDAIRRADELARGNDAIRMPRF